MDKRVQYVEARSQTHIKSSLPYDFPLGFYREGTILPVSVGAGLLPLRQGYCACRFTGHGRRPAIFGRCPASADTVHGLASQGPPAYSQARHLRIHRAHQLCIHPGHHLHSHRARRLRSNARPPASAATAPSPSARFTPVRGNCSSAIGSRVPSGAGAPGLPGCPGAVVGWADAVGLAVGWPGPAVGCPGADDAVGPAVGCGEVVGWPGVVGVPVGATVGLAVGAPVGAPVGLAVGAGGGWPG